MCNLCVGVFSVHVSDALSTEIWYWMPSVSECSGLDFLFSGFHLERFFFESLKLSLPFSIVIVVDSDCHCKDGSYKNIFIHFFDDKLDRCLPHSFAILVCNIISYKDMF